MTTDAHGQPARLPALVVGGTGMLAGVVRTLLGRGHPTAVAARRPERLADTSARPVAVDYGETGALEVALRDAVAEAGRPFGTAVLWVHTPHRARVQREVARWLDPTGALVVDVLGSATRSPHSVEPGVPEPFRHPSVTYRQAVLGFTDGPHGSRWLTDREISDGVTVALDTPGAEYVVGRVTPWSDRP